MPHTGSVVFRPSACPSVPVKYSYYTSVTILYVLYFVITQKNYETPSLCAGKLELAQRPHLLSFSNVCRFDSERCGVRFATEITFRSVRLSVCLSVYRSVTRLSCE